VEGQGRVDAEVVGLVKIGDAQAHVEQAVALRIVLNDLPEVDCAVAVFRAGKLLAGPKVSVENDGAGESWERGTGLR